MMGIIVTFFGGRAVRISLCSLDTASQAREPDSPDGLSSVAIASLRYPASLAKPAATSYRGVRHGVAHPVATCARIAHH
jgi:hypothetical protein